MESYKCADGMHATQRQRPRQQPPLSASSAVTIGEDQQRAWHQQRSVRPAAVMTISSRLREHLVTLFRDTCSLTTTLAHVVELGTTNVAAFFNFDLVNNW